MLLLSRTAVSHQNETLETLFHILKDEMERVKKRYITAYHWTLSGSVQKSAAHSGFRLILQREDGMMESSCSNQMCV